MALGSPPVPNSADRRAWLRSYHYYRAKLMEEAVGAEVISICQPLIEADGSWVPPVIEGAPEPAPPPPPPVEGKKPKVTNEAAKNLAPAELAGTPAAIHHALPFFKEGRIFADPWRLPDKAKSILKYFATKALEGEDADLLMPEPEMWRKWVPTIDGKGYGIVSLRGLDILRGLRMAGILSELERSNAEPIVWQVGPSATTARTLKMRLPRIRMLISCQPWEMVSAMAFLKAAVPDATVAMEADPAAVAGALAENDFVFTPNSAIGGLALPHLDLVLDAMSLQLLGEEAAMTHARKAYELGARYAFALTIDGESPEWKLTSAVPAFEPYFWMHQMPVRAVVEWQMATLIEEGFIARGYLGRPEDIKYWKLNPHFTMGWRRLKT